MNVREIQLSDFEDADLFEAQSDVEKFIKVLKAEYAEAKKKEEEIS